jgi:rubredoxin
VKYQCPNCEHVYDEAQGDPHEGFAPGTRWEHPRQLGLPRLCGA